MATIGATFRNDYGSSRQWVIWDVGRDPNSPPVIFNNYLEPGQSTDLLSLYSSDGVYAAALYQRSDGAPTNVDSITDNSQVSME